MGKVNINVMFKTFVYDTKKEKRNHIPKMLDDGWKIENEDKLKVEYRKSEMVKV